MQSSYKRERERESTMSSEEIDLMWKGVCEWTLKAPIEKVWDFIGDFLIVRNWATTLLESCTLVEGVPQEIGCVRLCIGNAYVDENRTPLKVFEKLLELDNSNHVISYEVTKSNNPIFLGVFPTIQLFHLSDSPSMTRIVFNFKRAASDEFNQEVFIHTMETLYSVVIQDLRTALDINS